MNERPREPATKATCKRLKRQPEAREPEVVGFEFPAGDEIVTEEFITHDYPSNIPPCYPMTQIKAD